MFCAKLTKKHNNELTCWDLRNEKLWSYCNDDDNKKRWIAHLMSWKRWSPERKIVAECRLSTERGATIVLRKWDVEAIYDHSCPTDVTIT